MIFRIFGKKKLILFSFSCLISVSARHCSEKIVNPMREPLASDDFVISVVSKTIAIPIDPTTVHQFQNHFGKVCLR